MVKHFDIKMHEERMRALLTPTQVPLIQKLRQAAQGLEPVKAPAAKQPKLPEIKQAI